MIGQLQHPTPPQLANSWQLRKSHPFEPGNYLNSTLQADLELNGSSPPPVSLSTALFITCSTSLLLTALWLLASQLPRSDSSRASCSGSTGVPCSCRVCKPSAKAWISRSARR